MARQGVDLRPGKRGRRVTVIDPTAPPVGLPPALLSAVVPPLPTGGNGRRLTPGTAALLARGLTMDEAARVATQNREAFSRRAAVVRFRVAVAAQVQSLRDYLAGIAVRGAPGTGLPAEIRRLDGWIQRHREE